MLHKRSGAEAASSVTLRHREGHYSQITELKWQQVTLLVAEVASDFCELQQALDSLQQARPSTQHCSIPLVFCVAVQQPFLSLQHFIPFSQQPSRSFDWQHAALSLQQASFAEQQSFDKVVNPTAPNAKVPNANNDPTKNFVNMDSLP